MRITKRQVVLWGPAIMLLCVVAFLLAFKYTSDRLETDSEGTIHAYHWRTGKELWRNYDLQPDDSLRGDEPSPFRRYKVHLSGSGKFHGRADFLDAAGNITRSKWYWYHQEVSEGEYERYCR